MDDQKCECCEGTQILTPASVANRPGLSALTYRVGTHARFLETMKARLSNMLVEIPNPEDPEKSIPANPLTALTTRAPDDPAIALLDGWATVADVLTFYQERFANEGFLRTATERRSVLELARLIGYSLRPGVAASAFLALELDKDHDVLIQPKEIKAQTVPGPGEMPQTFENNEPLEARYAWNKLQPRMARPQTLKSILTGDAHGNVRLYLKGISANLKQNDVMLLTGGGQQPAVYHVANATPEPADDRTLVTLKKMVPTAPAPVAFDASGIIAVAQNYITAQPAERTKARTEMSQRVVGHLKTLIDQLQTPGLSAEAFSQSFNEILAKISEERDMALGEQYTKLAPWLSGMVEKLNKTHQAMQAFAAIENATPATGPSQVKGDEFPPDPLKQAMLDLTKRASLPPRNTLNLDRNLKSAFAERADIGLQMSTAFDFNLSKSLPGTLANVKVTRDSEVRAYVFRAVARPFGHNAPPRATVTTGTPVTYEEWKMNEPLGKLQTVSDPKLTAAVDVTAEVPSPHHEPDRLYLDGEYKIQSDNGWVVMDGPGFPISPLFLNLANGDAEASQQSLAAYGISGKTTLMNLKNEKVWTTEQISFTPVRTSVVYAESEELPLAEEPLDADISDGDIELIELDELYSGMQSGRWVVVSGERKDITDANKQSVSSVNASELVMLAEVIQDIATEEGKPFYYSQEAGTPLAGDKTHTWIRLAKKLEYCYQRDKVTIYGNVLKASHGETRKEALGNGDASQAFQSFTLKQPPLTFVSSPTPAGAESTLVVYVNDVRWHESDSLAGLGPTDRKFVTKTDDASKTTVIFGNGQTGARLPTGPGNLRAEYRNGIGRSGNVQAEQISLLMSKPLGVQGVINPLHASGGADRESMDTARKNAPMTVTALDRLVSVSDYADFARTFAGIGKSVATRVSHQQREVVLVTIAGADDIPIDDSSDLYRNLLRALRNSGDPHLPVALQVRLLVLLIISANVRILPDYQWDPVVKTVRARLLDTFSFERRELGQDVLLSEVIAAIQSVRGVAYVDVDVLGFVPEKMKTRDVVTDKPILRLLTPQEISQRVQGQIGAANMPIEVGKQQQLKISRRNKLRQPMQRFPLSSETGISRNGLLIPAGLAYLTPDVADTLILNQVK